MVFVGVCRWCLMSLLLLLVAVRLCSLLFDVVVCGGGVGVCAVSV